MGGTQDAEGKEERRGYNGEEERRGYNGEEQRRMDKPEEEIVWVRLSVWSH